MPGFFTPIAAWLLLLIPPLVALYFLKLKRPRLEIPSLVLWQQVLNDSRVNSPFQRFKRNLLLLLQLLLLLLLIIAAMQPYWRGDRERAHHIPILIDISASMGALRQSNRVTAIELAKRRVAEMIDGLLPDQRLCLIAFDRTAHKLTGFTNNKRLLREALENLKVADVPSDVEDALRTTEALSRTVSFKRVHLLSDGNFPQKMDFELPFAVDYEQIVPAGANLGITSLNSKRGSGGQWDVFVYVESSSADEKSATIELYQDGELLVDAVTRLTLDETEGERLRYVIAAQKRSSLEVRLRPDGFDALAADNRAYLDLEPARDLEIFVPRDLVAYRTALEGFESLRLFPPAVDKEPQRADFDIVISREEKDLRFDAFVYLFDGVVPEDVRSMVTVTSGDTAFIDWQRNAPLLEHVELADVIVLEDPTLEAQVREGDFEALGYEVLAYGNRGPLVLRKAEASRIYYYSLFKTDQSTLPYRVGFPILLWNLVNQGRHLAGLAEARGHRTGVLPALSVEPSKTFDVIDRDGNKRSYESDPQGTLWGVPALQVGRYEIRDGLTQVAAIGVGLLDAAETKLQTVDQIEFNELRVDVAERPMKVDRSFWPTLAMIALVVLTVEWWFFHKRPRGVRR